MGAAAFIGVDWGTSNARFILADADGTALEERSGPGIARLNGAEAIEAACFQAIEGWIDVHGPVPVILAGMVGSNIGWHLAPYVATPATTATISAAQHCFLARNIQFILIPGVSTTRHDGLPDVMRGEETQIIGCDNRNDRLYCLPGTHVKWVVVKEQAITAFHTAMTGELLDILGNHSILLNPKRALHATISAAFADGVRHMQKSMLGLESLLFTTRSRQIMADLQTEDADSYLAGLCIGADIRSATSLYADATCVTVVGSPVLTTLYATALDIYGYNSEQIDGRDAVLAGLHKAYLVAASGESKYG